MFYLDILCPVWRFAFFFWLFCVLFQVGDLGLFFGYFCPIWRFSILFGDIQSFLEILYQFPAKKKIPSHDQPVLRALCGASLQAKLRSSRRMHGAETEARCPD